MKIPWMQNVRIKIILLERIREKNVKTWKGHIVRIKLIKPLSGKESTAISLRIKIEERNALEDWIKG